MVGIFIVLYLLMAHAIEPSHTLMCYSCSGGQACGILFAPNSTSIRKITSKADEPFPSCSISVTPEGLTSRDLVPSRTCRSSAYQFCCNEDLCNSLPSPPLPALTSRKCAIGKCVVSDGICVNDAAYVTLLSSATESCSITSSKGVHYKYYKKNCQATVRDISSQRSSLVSTPPLFCCNTPECNRDIVINAVKDSTIQCYTCDSRITGLAGCMIFNESSPYVYRTGTSSHSEACATIIGTEGRDAVTGAKYPAFAMRTFISKCVNQKWGTVSYGGATFQGRIECCTSHLCNKQNIAIPKRRRKLPKIVFIIIGAAGCGALIVLIGIIVGIVYRSRQKKSKGKYDSCATSEPANQLALSARKVKSETSQRVSTGAYPEASAAP